MAFRSRKFRRAFKKAYRKGKSRRYGKGRVPGGLRLVRGALRTAGSYAMGQARAELKFCDSLCYNVGFVGGAARTGNVDWLVQSKVQAAGSPTNVVIPAGGGEIEFANNSAANPVGSNFAGRTGQPGILLNNVTLGTDATQRIGRKIQIKSFRVQVNASLDPAVNGTQIADGADFDTAMSPVGLSQTVRLVVVWDKQANGVQAMSTDVFVDMNGWNGSTSHMQLNNRDRFVILADERKTIGPAGNNAVSFDIYKECDLTTIFTRGPSPQDISSIASGALYLFALGSTYAVQPTGLTTVNPRVCYGNYAQCRIRYLDA